MIMGDKIVKVEDTILSMGGYILSILKNSNMSIDRLYEVFLQNYPKKVKFDDFIYAVDFLYMIKKVKIKHSDILELRR
ncbi:hypothetical protein QJU96_00185 [Pasteurella skyensis]|uniref:Uncharacterized protein n=1 Tax=Phocoenobacter skyensis TaxID=97481 RepID=A0AAJ6NBV8_9PAST|nr:ABC-three component system middle component 6 [Pasteurella skyensis]MDP8169712.1 hypothetical protein [Pasteurella skyensis]MDP8173962.1 hypothetical protein [Pasteurella skyensis]